MSHCVSNMIGIRTGGVFSPDVDIEDMKGRIANIVAEMRDGYYWTDIEDDPHCISGELAAHKGGYVVIAGVFNYWIFNRSSEFSRRLSKEFSTEVMHMCWDETNNTVQCQVFLNGHPLFEVAENPVGRILRRVAQ